MDLFKTKDIDDAINGSTGIIKEVTENNKLDVFYMLCFCLMVPQSKAIKAEIAVQELKNKDFYNKHISQDDLAKILKPNVRFHNNKSKYLLAAKEKFNDVWPQILDFYQSQSEIKNNLDKMNFLQKIRDYLIQCFAGMSMKVGSHFMRNVGMIGLSILDVHVLHGLHKRGIINSHSFPLTKKRYCDIEASMLAYASTINFSIDELDLCLWKERTGFVFK